MSIPEPTYSTHIEAPDAVLIGSGIMSATMGVMLKILRPELRLQMYEVTGQIAQESSHGWNNAGTGHAGLCELSYTPHQRADGSVDVSKAIQVYEEFETSRQFWAFLVQQGIVADASQFIRRVPHLSFVSGDDHVAFLQARYQALRLHPFFNEMEFTSDPATVAEWAPLLMQGRTPGPVAATRVQAGTDVNFGALARSMVSWLTKQPGCGVASGHRVRKVSRHGDGWQLRVEDTRSGAVRTQTAGFLFIGAGGGSLPLLQQTGIPESRGIGGFPIGGQWLVCSQPEIVNQHHAKVYGQALGAAPTMAVPHLDTRVLDDERVLLFGPFAAWTGKFLHGGGSHFDLLRSVRHHNALTLTNIGLKNLDLIRYLVQQGRQSKSDRMHSLRDFYPGAREEDWRLIDAGIRVQTMKRSDGKAGIVHYGTEIVTDKAGSVSALLGASPGASVSASIILGVLERCMPVLFTEKETRDRLLRMIPTFGKHLRSTSQVAAFETARRTATELLRLNAA